MDSSKRGKETINPNKPSSIKKAQSKTIRLTIDLSQTDKDGCAIFNYQELVKEEEKRLNALNKPKQLNNGAVDPFNNEDEEALKKIAIHYEEKYGSGSMRYQTYTELGAGYDESDSFIDNTEACEEGVPEDTEPKRGGFYINSGKLEYKRVHGYYDPKNKRKWVIDSESGEDESSLEEKSNIIDGSSDKEKIEKSEESDCRMSNGNKSSNKIRKMTKIKISDEPTKERSSKSSSYSELVVEQMPKSHSGSTSSEIKEPCLSNESTECFDVNFTDERKETIRSQPIVSETSCVPDKKNNENPEIIAIISETESSNSTDRGEYQKGEPPKLPELSEVIVIVNELKSLARNYKNSQRKFFNEITSALLYKLESTCRKQLNSSGRHAVYSHLAHYLPFTKSTLVSRIKKIFVGNGKLESLIVKIKDVVASYNETTEDYDLQHQVLKEIKPFLEQLVQMKVRQFIVTSKKKGPPLESYITDFLSYIATIWPNGNITVNHLQSLVLEAIKTEAIAYNITYSPIVSITSDPIATQSRSLIEITPQSQKTNTEHDEIIESTGNEYQIKLTDETPLSVSNKDKDLKLIMKLSHKKLKNGGGKWIHQSGKKIDDRGIERDIELKEKCVPKFSSTDEKVLMQLDQVMQDLVVLNQMSSDTTSNTK